MPLGQNRCLNTELLHFAEKMLNNVFCREIWFSLLLTFKVKRNTWTCKKIGKIKNEIKIEIMFIITYHLQYYIHMNSLITGIILLFLFSLQFSISNITKCVTDFFLPEKCSTQGHTQGRSKFIQFPGGKIVPTSVPTTLLPRTSLKIYF